MLTPFLAFDQKQTLTRSLAMLLLLVSSLSGFSEEPPQKPELAKKPEIAPEKKNILNYRAYRPTDSIFKSSSINLPSSALPVPAAPAPRTSRQDREFLDRQKNWIFVLPNDAKKKGSGEDVLGVDETFDDRNSKSVITRFLENKEGIESKTSGPNANRFESSRNFGAQPIFGTQKQNGLNSLSQAGTPPENIFGSRAPKLSLAERWQEMHGPSGEKFREEKRARMSEFENLFTSQSIAPANGIGLQNNLNSQVAAPNGSDSFNRYTPTGPAAFRTPARPLSGANESAPPNINTRVFGSPASAPAPEPVRRAPVPAILPIPKRHF